MIAKLLLTLALILIVLASLSTRKRQTQEQDSTSNCRSTIPWQRIRAGAYGMIAIIVIVSGWSLVHRWHYAHAVVDIQVVNPATGAIDHYQARRNTIKGRGFQTLDGNQVRIAEFERMILSDLK